MATTTRRDFLQSCAAALLVLSGVGVAGAALPAPNLVGKLKGTSLAPLAAGDISFKLLKAGEQPTFTLTCDNLGAFQGKAVTVEVIRGRTRLGLTRPRVSATGEVDVSLRLAATTLRAGDTIRLTESGRVLAEGTFGAARQRP
jgi:hypothetical protein